jgi:hypothetical protein
MAPKQKDTAKKPPRSAAEFQLLRNKQWDEIQAMAGTPGTPPPWRTTAKPKAPSPQKEPAPSRPPPPAPPPAQNTAKKKPPPSAPDLRRSEGGSSADACQERLRTAERGVKTAEEKLAACAAKVERLAQKAAAFAAERGAAPRDAAHATELERLRVENRACQERLGRELGRLPSFCVSTCHIQIDNPLEARKRPAGDCMVHGCLPTLRQTLRMSWHRSQLRNHSFVRCIVEKNIERPR